MRKLASLQKIEEIRPIEGADKIETAIVTGYSAVVQKGKFKPGETIIYVECDAIVPSDVPAFAFMEKAHWRVKIMKLRGQVSQGLVMAIEDIESVYTYAGDLEIGLDVTDLIGITLYIPKAAGAGSGSIAGVFPWGVGKSDESRVQSYLGCLDELRGLPFYITQKINGMSGTYVARDGAFSVCSRNYTLNRSDGCAFHEVGDRYGLPEWMPVVDNLAIQGEVAGPGIQKNQQGLESRDLFVFKAKDLTTGKPHSFDELREMCCLRGLTMVPVLAHGDKFDYDLPALLALANVGKYDSGHPAEGLVCRPKEPMRSETLGGANLSFKVLSEPHLLAEG